MMRLFEGGSPLHQHRVYPLYRRVYVDHQRKMFCDTCLHLDGEHLQEIKGEDATLVIFKADLTLLGYEQVSRKLLEVLLQNQ